MKKEMNNKGFSLVELIVVIAIMAVLVGILAPQFLRYVEKSRLQKDNTAISEIANAAKTACAEEKVYSKIGAGTSITATSGVFTIGNFQTDLAKDVAATVGATVTLTSKAYTSTGTGSAIPTIKVIAGDNGVVSVSCDGYMPSVGGTATTQAF